MDILESVALRHRLEGRLSREREVEKEVLVEHLIRQGVGLGDQSPSSSPTHVRGSETDWEEELALLGISGLGRGEGLGLGEGSDFAYLDELRGGAGGLDDVDYDPDHVDSIIERFGGGGGIGSRSEGVQDDEVDEEEEET